MNSVFTHNDAIGCCGNPAESDTPGGGSGGAIYNDGNTMTLRVADTKITHNRSNGEGGSAIFFVSNDMSGDVRLEQSIIRNNIGGSWHILPGIAMHDDTTQIVDEDSILSN